MKRSFFTKLIALSPLAPIALKAMPTALEVEESWPPGTWLRFSNGASGELWSGTFAKELTTAARLQGVRGLGYDRVHQIIDGAVYETEALEDVIRAWPR
jgi:hypothetical protein